MLQITKFDTHENPVFPTVSERGDGATQKLPDKNWFLTFGKMLCH